jgi:hypothetical protein
MFLVLLFVPFVTSTTLPTLTITSSSIDCPIPHPDPTYILATPYTETKEEYAARFSQKRTCHWVQGEPSGGWVCSSSFSGDRAAPFLLPYLCLMQFVFLLVTLDTFPFGTSIATPSTIPDSTLTCIPATRSIEPGEEYAADPSENAKKKPKHKDPNCDNCAESSVRSMRPSFAMWYLLFFFFLPTPPGSASRCAGGHYDDYDYDNYDYDGCEYDSRPKHRSRGVYATRCRCILRV